MHLKWLTFLRYGHERPKVKSLDMAKNFHSSIILDFLTAFRRVGETPKERAGPTLSSHILQEQM